MNQLSLNEDLFLFIFKYFKNDELLTLRLINTQFNNLILKHFSLLTHLKLPTTKNDFCLFYPKLFPNLTFLEFEYCQIITKNGTNFGTFNYTQKFLKCLLCPEKVSTLIVKNYRIKCEFLKIEFWSMLSNSFTNLNNLTFTSPLLPLIQLSILPPQNLTFSCLEKFTLVTKHRLETSVADFFYILLLLSSKIKILNLKVNWSSKNNPLHLTGSWAENCQVLMNRLETRYKNKNIEKVSLYDIFATMSKFNKLTSLTLYLEANSISIATLNPVLFDKYYFLPLQSLTFFEFYLKVNRITEESEMATEQQVKKLNLQKQIIVENFPFNLTFFKFFISKICPNLKILKCKLVIDGTVFEKVDEKL